MHFDHVWPPLVVLGGSSPSKGSRAMGRRHREEPGLPAPAVGGRTCAVHRPKGKAAGREGTWKCDGPRKGGLNGRDASLLPGPLG